MLAGVTFRISFLPADGIRAASPGPSRAGDLPEPGARASIWCASVSGSAPALGIAAPRTGNAPAEGDAKTRARCRQESASRRGSSCLARRGAGHKCAPSADSEPNGQVRLLTVCAMLPRVSFLTYARVACLPLARVSCCTRRGSAAVARWLLLLHQLCRREHLECGRCVVVELVDRVCSKQVPPPPLLGRKWTWCQLLNKFVSCRLSTT